MTATLETPERASDSIPNTRRWARLLHGDQKDKNGLPYVTHLDAVAKNLVRFFGFDWELIVACYLHDTVEDVKDGGFSIKTIENEGYSDRTVYVVNVVTKRTSEPNPDYTTRVIKGGADPMKVKLADLYHNTDPERLALLSADKQKRLKEKYYSAIFRIENALVNLGEMREEDRTIDFQEAFDAVKPTYNYTTSSTYSGSGWYKRSLVSMWKGDLIRFPKSADPDKEYLILEKRVKSNGAYALTLEGWDGDVVLTSASEYESLFQSSATYSTKTTYVPMWKQRLGLGADWEEGDEVPRYLHGEKIPEVTQEKALVPYEALPLVDAVKEVAFSDK